MFDPQCIQKLSKFNQTCVEAFQTYSIQPGLFIMHIERMASEDMRPDVRAG